MKISSTTISMLNKVKQGKLSRELLIHRIVATLEKTHTKTMSRNIAKSILERFNIK